MASLCAAAVEDGIAGHFIETGVWRGGSSFVAAKTFDMLGADAHARRVYMADSFSGIPNQADYVPAVRLPRERAALSARSADANAHRLFVVSNNSLDHVRSNAAELHRDRSAFTPLPRRSQVRSNAAALHLDRSRLAFVPGWFNESLPELLRREGDALQFAIIRLDGDTYASTFETLSLRLPSSPTISLCACRYASTYEALSLLYPRLSPGGFLIVDDYVDWPTCRDAIHDFRKAHQVDEPDDSLMSSMCACKAHQVDEPLVLIPHNHDDPLTTR